LRYIIIVIFLIFVTGCTNSGLFNSFNTSSVDRTKRLREADILNNRGVEAYHRGDYKLAISLYKKSLTIKKRLLGDRDLSVATTYNNLGLAYKKRGDFTKALSYISTSLKVREKVLGKKDTKISLKFFVQKL